MKLEYGSRYLMFGSPRNESFRGGAYNIIAVSDHLKCLIENMTLDEDGCWLYGNQVWKEPMKCAWWHILDTKTMCIVAGSEDRADIVDIFKSMVSFPWKNKDE